MKKISVFIAILLVMGLASYAFAENSATAFSGKTYREQQVFIQCYNGSGSDISSNYVVILDTSASNIASGSTLGAYITTTTTADSALVLGVTDEVIANGRTGRVCVRGPHKAYLASLPSYASVGATLSTTTTAGAGSMASTQGAGVFGVLLYNAKIGSGLATGDSSTDGFKAGDGISNYWVWVTK